MTSIVAMLMIFAHPMMKITKTPLETPQSCFDVWVMDMAHCRTTAPDSTSLERAVCEAEANGRYEACMTFTR